MSFPLNLIPRIQGKVGQATEPPEMVGKWFFEMTVSGLGGGTILEPRMIGPWETEEIAQQELRRACQLVAEYFEKKLVGKVSGKYVDMKSNKTRRWDKGDEN